ncbi:hypothetical protein [Paraburkholderia sp. RL17-337-BIB-A]|uniref:hypothetical protein n=1 Tax=Paraburkholderia sp. RL17-337-BIB-A TaxID=3031636 RepID=UPI0038BC6B4C
MKKGFLLVALAAISAVAVAAETPLMCPTGQQKVLVVYQYSARQQSWGFGNACSCSGDVDTEAGIDAFLKMVSRKHDGLKALIVNIVPMRG